MNKLRPRSAMLAILAAGLGTTNFSASARSTSVAPALPLFADKDRIAQAEAKRARKAEIRRRGRP